MTERFKQIRTDTYLDHLNRYRAVLIGTAIGDTLGMPVEGWKKEQIHKYVGRITKPIAPVLLKDKQEMINLADKLFDLPGPEQR
jgi:hypothetical protein